MPAKFTFSEILLFCGVAILGSCKSTGPRYLMKTDAGDIQLAVYTRKAPLTAANFVKYVAEKRYEGAHFYRVVRMDNQPDNQVKIEVIQGGLDSTRQSSRLPAIGHETTAQTGLLHRDGTLSMARSQPGSAHSEFFICINDQPQLDYGGKRNPDGQGFAAFGKVTKGMAVVRKIQAGETDKQALKKPVKISSITKIK
ncbi:MAG: peptidylprolyl isomerase [Ferruginibacter sp.]|nr:peptidylprolyl isomerase [Cytophagales bacterium]